jgi:Tfp pilus assembly protein PilO
MAKLIQLDFFEETEISILKAEIVELKKSLDRQRKSQFAKIGECKKEIIELKEDMEILKRNICKPP